MLLPSVTRDSEVLKDRLRTCICSAREGGGGFRVCPAAGTHRRCCGHQGGAAVPHGTAQGFGTSLTRLIGGVFKDLSSRLPPMLGGGGSEVGVRAASKRRANAALPLPPLKDGNTAEEAHRTESRRPRGSAAHAHGEGRATEDDDEGSARVPPSAVSQGPSGTPETPAGPGKQRKSAHKQRHPTPAGERKEGRKDCVQYGGEAGARANTPAASLSPGTERQQVLMALAASAREAGAGAQGTVTSSRQEHRGGASARGGKGEAAGETARRGELRGAVALAGRVRPARGKAKEGGPAAHADLSGPIPGIPLDEIVRPAAYYGHVVVGRTVVRIREGQEPGKTTAPGKAGLLGGLLQFKGPVVPKKSLSDVKTKSTAAPRSTAKPMANATANPMASPGRRRKASAVPTRCQQHAGAAAHVCVTVVPNVAHSGGTTPATARKAVAASKMAVATHALRKGLARASFGGVPAFEEPQELTDGSAEGSGDLGARAAGRFAHKRGSLLGPRAAGLEEGSGRLRATTKVQSLASLMGKAERAALERGRPRVRAACPTRHALIPVRSFPPLNLIRGGFIHKDSWERTWQLRVPFHDATRSQGPEPPPDRRCASWCARARIRVACLEVSESLRATVPQVCARARVLRFRRQKCLFFSFSPSRQPPKHAHAEHRHAFGTLTNPNSTMTRVGDHRGGPDPSTSGSTSFQSSGGCATIPEPQAPHACQRETRGGHLATTTTNTDRASSPAARNAPQSTAAVVGESRSGDPGRGSLDGYLARGAAAPASAIPGGTAPGGSCSEDEPCAEPAKPCAWEGRSAPGTPRCPESQGCGTKEEPQDCTPKVAEVLHMLQVLRTHPSSQASLHANKGMLVRVCEPGLGTIRTAGASVGSIMHL